MSTMPGRVMALADEKGIDREILKRGFDEHRLKYDGDFMTLREMYEAIWKDAGLEIDGATTELFMKEDSASWLCRRERTREWMAELKERGFRIGILTNMNSGFGNLHFKKVFADYIGLADAMVISGEVRLYKPMREIYDLMRERIALPAHELCFIDDVEKNVEAARAAGWQAIRFISNEQTERDFERLCPH